jgi:outer membrane protein TolC
MAVSLAQTNVDLARSLRLPEIAVRGTFEANRQGFVTRGGSDWMTGATLQWNLFRGFGDRARIAESALIKTQSELERSRTESALQLQVRQSYWSFESAVNRISVAQSAIAEATENRRIVTDRYEAGLANVTELLRSQTALSMTELRLAEAIYDQRLAAARLERAAGTLLPSSDALKP